MSKRSPQLLLDDILQAVIKIQQYSNGLDVESFSKQFMILEATLYNFQVIGEASNQLPEEIKADSPQVDWKKLKGYRNRLIHEYFGTDPFIVFEIIQLYLPELKVQIQTLLDNYQSQ
jgi:uncharacterized protein with HEPN domain